MNTEFGRLSTTQEGIWYAILLEQRETNRILQSLVPKVVEPEPEPEPEVIVEPEPEIIPEKVSVKTDAEKV